MDRNGVRKLPEGGGRTRKGGKVLFRGLAPLVPLVCVTDVTVSIVLLLEHSSVIKLFYFYRTSSANLCNISYFPVPKSCTYQNGPHWK